MIICDVFILLNQIFSSKLIHRAGDLYHPIFVTNIILIHASYFASIQRCRILNSNSDDEQQFRYVTIDLPTQVWSVDTYHHQDELINRVNERIPASVICGHPEHVREVNWVNERIPASVICGHPRQLREVNWVNERIPASVICGHPPHSREVDRVNERIPASVIWGHP